MGSTTEDELSAGDDSALLSIPLAALLEYCDPTLDDPWGCGRIHSEDVLNEVGYTRQRAKPLDYDDEVYSSYEYNIERIAYFVEHGWESAGSDAEPITVDIGLAGYTPFHLLVDGNHRVAAAKIRGDETITIELIGDVSKAEAVFLQGVHPDDYSRFHGDGLRRASLD